MNMCHIDTGAIVKNISVTWLEVDLEELIDWRRNVNEGGGVSRLSFNPYVIIIIIIIIIQFMEKYWTRIQ